MKNDEYTTKPGNGLINILVTGAEFKQEIWFRKGKGYMKPGDGLINLYASCYRSCILTKTRGWESGKV